MAFCSILYSTTNATQCLILLTSAGMGVNKAYDFSYKNHAYDFSYKNHNDRRSIKVEVTKYFCRN